MEENLTYESALRELESILRSMQSDQCDIDKLAAMTRRATELLASCRARLTTTEAELRQILASLEEA
ncbi:MAG: exodeoxyribonuclease VII small subunit [Bacteroidales bacterium]|nr:exodeoxyribonuclease VII small subunit [Bacteroidales bacterium]